MIIKLHSTYTGREILTYDADVIPRIGEHIVISRSPNAENELLPGSGGTTVCEVANVGHWVEESTLCNRVPIVRVGLNCPFEKFEKLVSKAFSEGPPTGEG
jgi:hypothetical protein